MPRTNGTIDSSNHTGLPTVDDFSNAQRQYARIVTLDATERTLASLALREPSEAKIVRIADTLSLEKLEVSEACAEFFSGRNDLEVLGRAEEMRFDDSGNLRPLRVNGAPAQVGHGA